MQALRLGGLTLEGVQAHGAVVAVKDAVVQGVQALALVLLIIEVNPEIPIRHGLTGYPLAAITIMAPLTCV